VAGPEQADGPAAPGAVNSIAAGTLLTFSALLVAVNPAPANGTSQPRLLAQEKNPPLPPGSVLASTSVTE
jgi:hypothetical protein